MDPIAFIAQNELEKQLLSALDGSLPGEEFIHYLLDAQVFMPILNETSAIKGFQRTTKAQPLLIPDENGDDVLILFTSPGRAREFVAYHPGFDGGLLTEFSWVLRKLDGPLNIALNPGYETVGEIYSTQHSQYTEATQYCYYNGMHELTLFWARPTLKEIKGFHNQPVEISLYVENSVLFLLYRIVDICEWSDVAYNIHLLRAEELAIPSDKPGTRAKMQITLVNADSGIILAKRMLHLSPVMTQALRHTLQEQKQNPVSRTEYSEQVRQAYTRHPDSDAMLKNAWMVETAETDLSIN
jgi:SseB protein N-terminal domain